MAGRMLLCAVGCSLAFVGRVALGQSSEIPATGEPRLLAPGVISTLDGEYSPTLDVGRGELVFMRRTPGLFDYTLMVSRFDGEGWSEPETLPFSGDYRDAGSGFSMDGGTLYFDSRRPAVGVEARSINIWRVDREGDGWGEPSLVEWASLTDNEESAAGADEFGPVVGGDGELYFYSFREPYRGGMQYRRGADGRAEAATELPDPSASTFVGYLAMSPDGRTIVIEGRAPGRRDTDLFVSRLGEDGAWSEPVGIDGVNTRFGEGTPSISSDGRLLFFGSDRPTGDGRVGESSLYVVLLEGVVGR